MTDRSNLILLMLWPVFFFFFLAAACSEKDDAQLIHTLIKTGAELAESHDVSQIVWRSSASFGRH